VRFSVFFFNPQKWLDAKVLTTAEVSVSTLTFTVTTYRLIELFKPSKEADILLSLIFEN